METRISVIVPVYNVEKYLERCVKSLTDQTLREIQIILVDDGSLAVSYTHLQPVWLSCFR